ncbi:hypothetical protein J6590_037420 [Homalodisca vitripennis]|nr:hypothetical protein J6590_037420 [Homalodisca vitripennis]
MDGHRLKALTSMMVFMPTTKHILYGKHLWRCQKPASHENTPDAGEGLRLDLMEMQDKKTGVNEEEEHGPSGGIYPRVSLDADRSSFRRISPYTIIRSWSNYAMMTPSQFQSPSPPGNYSNTRPPIPPLPSPTVTSAEVVSFRF